MHKAMAQPSSNPRPEKFESASNKAINDSLAKVMRARRIRGCRVIGSEDDMAQVIEFYVPTRFRRKVKWVPPTQRGKLLEFPADMKKSA